MGAAINLTGQRFGRIVARHLAKSTRKDKRMWLCACDCGRDVLVSTQDLRNGHTQSCGCLRKDLMTTHGMSDTLIYGVWVGMRVRCNDPKEEAWKDYGGRGIKVCERWQSSFDAFYQDIGKSWVRGMELDRIDNDGNYEPGNVRWATRKQNSRNKRTNRYLDLEGGRVTVAEVVERTGLSHGCIRYRLRTGMGERTGLLAPARSLSPRRVVNGEVVERRAPIINGGSKERG